MDHSETAYIQNNNLLMLTNTPDAGGCSMWKHSELNTINLNTNFINNIGTTRSNMIIATTWKVSGYSVANATAKTIYNEEITNATKTYGSNDEISKIGLMYVSDYGFAAIPEVLTLTMKSYDNATATENNWMYSGFTEWCISPKNNYAVVQLSALGDIINSGVKTVTISKIYPVFYLKPEILYISGSATKDNPIRII